LLSFVAEVQNLIGQLSSSKLKDFLADFFTASEFSKVQQMDKKKQIDEIQRLLMTDAWRAKQFEALCEKYSLT
jgi:hypothetical protein